MVLEVLAASRQVVQDAHSERIELLRVADTRELQQLRRVDRAAAEDDLVRRHDVSTHLDAGRPRPLEDDPLDERPAAQLEVRSPEHRVEIRAGGTEPPSPVNVPVELREAFLLPTVDVVRQRVARLLHGFEERPEQRALGGPTFEYERALAA